MSKRKPKLNPITKSTTPRLEGFDFFPRGFMDALQKRQEASVTFDLNKYIATDATDIRVFLHFNGTRHEVRLTRQR